MEGKFKKGKEVLVEKLELPKDVILDIPKIIVMGRNEITIENHKGIQIFEKNKIKINTNMAPIEIKGNNFITKLNENNSNIWKADISNINNGYPILCWQ